MMILSDEPLTGAETWVHEQAGYLRHERINTVALVALMDDGKALTAYYQANCFDKALCAVHIHADFVDELIRSNFDSYLEDISPDGD